MHYAQILKFFLLHTLPRVLNFGKKAANPTSFAVIFLNLQKNCFLTYFFTFYSHFCSIINKIKSKSKDLI